MVNLFDFVYVKKKTNPIPLFASSPALHVCGYITRRVHLLGHFRNHSINDVCCSRPGLRLKWPLTAPKN